MLSELNTIIEQTTDLPTIINEKSKYVVCTYWWGRGNLNGNTARPCISFYETFFNGVRQQALNVLNMAYVNDKESVKKEYNNLEYTIFKSNNYLKLVNKHVDGYMYDLNQFLNNPDNVLEKEIEKKIKQGKMPIDYIYKEKAQLEDIFKIFGILYILSNKANIFKVFIINNDIQKLQEQYLNKTRKISEKEYTKALPKSETIEKAEFIVNQLEELSDIEMLHEESVADSKEAVRTMAKVASKAKARAKEEEEQAISRAEKEKARKELERAKEKSRAEAEKKYYIDKVKTLVSKKNAIIAEIKKSLGIKQNYNVNKINSWFNIESRDVFMLQSRKKPIATIYLDNFQNKSINEVLNENLRYLNPIRFEEMIALWEEKCAKNGCNYMAIEYPQFAKPGGYQMAINAKPLFIKKALELCGGRGVLYIDGDMTINKYPAIFDMDDIDFMARGWHIDPRSSWKMEESITFDPYNFETSGGTMFFSQSVESKGLIDAWITEAQKPYQVGKADDRILSLVFNTKGFLGSLKFIQLPVEYLWLTLDYDDRMMDYVYDYDKHAMQSSIFIEHPECLTTEDTAAGAGASSDRTPKFYSFLQDTIPVSEVCFERIIFDNAEQTKVFEDYFKYMKTVTYKNDGNPELYEKGLVVLDEDGEVEYAESPIHIVDYKNNFARYNKISEINFAEARKMNNDQSESSNGLIIVKDNIIPTIMFHLMNGRVVLYDPTHKIKYNPAYKKELLENPIYDNLSLVFSPSGTSTIHSNFFKTGMMLNQPIMFKPDRRLIDMLSIHESLESFSNMLSKGAYWFISLIRMGFTGKPQKRIGGSRKLKPSLLRKTRRSKMLSSLEEQYRHGLQLLYGKGK